MEIAIDLHAHSMYAGGSGGLSLKKENLKTSEKKSHARFHVADINSRLKGLQILGSGDIQFTPWLNFFKNNFSEENGLFLYNQGGDLRYCLQTEIIVTASQKGSKKRKSTHVVLLFPDFASVDEFKLILEKYQVKQEKIARPFVKLRNNLQVSEFFYGIRDSNSYIEVIPGHVMTPEGVYGGNNGVNSLADFFGPFEQEISIVETGLSADPEILAIIPELDDRTLLSNSDAHSAQLHRIGREFTVINSDITYKSMIDNLRNRKIAYSLEFPPSEGRYFLTGHRANRKKPGTGHSKLQFCYFSPEYIPANNICPICTASLTKGVLQRVFEICSFQGQERTLKEVDRKQTYLHGVPLVEVIASALNLKSPDAKTVVTHYNAIIEALGPEVSIWKAHPDYILGNIPDSVSDNIIKAIIQVKQDNFSFNPPGYDGSYGRLVIGKKLDYFGHAFIAD